MAKRGKEANVDVEAVVNDISRKMARLRVLYDQYFLGIEKRAPLTLQKDVVRLIRSLERVHIRQTALKFRYRSLVQKFQSYRAYWMRTTREIENGTYRRHQVRDKKRINRREKQRQHQENGVVEIDIDMEDIAELDLNDPSVLTPADTKAPFDGLKALLTLFDMLAFHTAQIGRNVGFAGRVRF
ncbi:MAG: hypothetical protein AAFX99_32070, partial [Myxococcota bacterium]